MEDEVETGDEDSGGSPPQADALHLHPPLPQLQSTATSIIPHCLRRDRNESRRHQQDPFLQSTERPSVMSGSNGWKLVVQLLQPRMSRWCSRPISITLLRRGEVSLATKCQRKLPTGRKKRCVKSFISGFNIISTDRSSIRYRALLHDYLLQIQPLFRFLAFMI